MYLPIACQCHAHVPCTCTMHMYHNQTLLIKKFRVIFIVGRYIVAASGSHVLHITYTRIKYNAMKVCTVINIGGRGGGGGGGGGMHNAKPHTFVDNQEVIKRRPTV